MTERRIIDFPVNMASKSRQHTEEDVFALRSIPPADYSDINAERLMAIPACDLSTTYR